MAEAGGGADGGVDGGERARDPRFLIHAKERDFLVRNNGDQVKISSLDGKVVGLYFSASWCTPCLQFTPKLVEAYTELSSKGSNFEVIFVSCDEDEDEFQKSFSNMPWLAIPFSDADTRDCLNEQFDVSGIPHLVVLDASGKVITDEGVQIVRGYGSEGYPFTPERIEELKKEEEAARKNQTIQTVLASSSRDFVVSANGNKVPVTELEGKVVGLYFSINSFGSCHGFTQILVEMYRKLKEKGENFEVVLVSLDDEESSYKEGLAGMPWLAIPFMDKICEKLIRYFELETIPTLAVIGSDGKTLHGNAVELVEDYGVEAYPFSPEKLAELEEKKKAIMEAQTLESLLVSGELDYIIGKEGLRVPVSELVGKRILLYFSAQWCPPCRAFLPKLIETYQKIKEKDSAFEVIFVSSDQDQSSFDDFFAGMPWLALPFGDERKKFLSRTFKVQDIPSLVALDPNGKTITKDARDLVMVYGADAYPFTKKRIKELEAEIEEMAKEWPGKLKHALHEEHELVRARRDEYICDRCEEDGHGWSFYCEECDFDLHPKCALDGEEKGDGDEDHEERQQAGK